MKAPRLLPLVGVAVGGVLAIKVITGVTDVPALFEGAKAFAEGVAPKKTADAGKAPAASDAPPKSDAPVLPPGLSAAIGGPDGANGAQAAQQQAQLPRLACGPGASELAKEAGLSPAELQVLQSLGTRRGQLDQREQDLDVQLQLMAAAEKKLDAKLAALSGLKGDIQGLLDKADQQKSTEFDRPVTVYSQMKPKDAAARFSLLDDSVRLPIAAKMKARALSAIVAQMAPADAKALTEKLAARFDNKQLADARSAMNGQPPAPAAAAPPPPAPQAAATPPAKPAADKPAKPQKQAKAQRPRKPRAKPTAVAANTAADAAASGNTAPKPAAGAAAPATAPAGGAAPAAKPG